MTFWRRRNSEMTFRWGVFGAEEEDFIRATAEKVRRRCGLDMDVRCRMLLGLIDRLDVPKEEYFVTFNGMT